MSVISLAKASIAATGGPNRLSRRGRGAGVEAGVGFAIEGKVGRLSSAMVLLAFRAGRPGEAWGEQAPGPQPGRLPQAIPAPATVAVTSTDGNILLIR